MVKLISIDYETHLISEDQPIPKPVCLSYYYEDKEEKHEGIVTGMDDMEVFLLRLFKEGWNIIAHNMSFELLVTDNYFPNLKSYIKKALQINHLHCTKIYEQLIDNNRKKSIHKFGLDNLVRIYFEEDISEDKHGEDSWRLRYSELDGVPLSEWPEEAKRYAIEDSKWAYKLFHEQLKENHCTQISVAADFYLNKMGLYGIHVSKDRVETLEKELLDKLNPKYEALCKLGLTIFDEKKNKYRKNMNKLREYIIENIEVPIKTPKKTISTTSEVLTEYLGKDISEETRQIFTDFLDIMKYEKVMTAFVSRLKEAKPLVRTQYNAVVSSGRTSSRTSNNFPSVNMQQMPRGVENVTWDIRNCFVPRDGYKICSIDYTGLELSSTANQLYTALGYSAMKETINNGKEPIDMHSMLAYRIYNMKEKVKVTYEEFVARKKEDKFKQYRQLAKPINLGFPGGIGYDTMRSLLAREGIYPKLVVLETAKYEDQLEWKRAITRKEGYPTRIRRVAFDEYQLIYDELVALKQELFSLYPDLEEFLTERHKNFMTGQYSLVKNEFGEWEKEDMYEFSTHKFNRNWCMYTQLCNGYLMQSPAAIGAKKALIKAMELYGDSQVIRPLAFIHDEIVFEVKENNYKVIDDMAEIMLTEMQSILKHVRIAVEAELMDYWQKSGSFWSKQYWLDPGDYDVKTSN